MLELNGKTYIPEKYLGSVISNHHNNPIHGYLEVTKTIELIRRYYTLLLLRKYVQVYVKGYIIY